MIDQASASYYENLPQKRIGAGCLLYDANDQLLLVKPSYKSSWEIPGGVVESNESPRTCCEREVTEELGLNIQIGRLLIVDYNKANPPKTESLMFIFDGGLLSQSDFETIRLAPKELSDVGFFPTEALPEMSPALMRRVLVARQQLLHSQTIYTEE